MTDKLALPEQIKQAIGPTMLLGLGDAELYGEPGAQRIREWVDWIAAAIAPIVQTEVEELTVSSPVIKPLFAEHASPESIHHQLKLARAERDRWQLHVEALTRLLDHRLGQIDEGTWPPKTEEV